MIPPSGSGSNGQTILPIDPRDAPSFVAELLARRLGYVPEWRPRARGADSAMLQVVARYLEIIAQRLNQAPYKNKLAFLDLLDMRLVPAQAARTPVVFRLSEDARDIRVPTGSRLAAAPPPGSSTQIVFETERSIGVCAARLKEVWSLWPGRDQSIDHSQAVQGGQPFQPFNQRLLHNTPHMLYLAHDTLLALAGKSEVDLIFELSTPGNRPVPILWEYWDGALWREFKAMRPACGEDAVQPLDSSAGLTRSGTIRLETDCAQTAKTTVNGLRAFWVRGWAQEPLPPDPARALPEVANIRLGAKITHPLAVTWRSEHEHATEVTEGHIVVKVRDESGMPLQGIQVVQVVDGAVTSSSTDANGECTDVNGESPFHLWPSGQKHVVVASIGDIQQIESFTPTNTSDPEQVTFTLAIDGLRLDVAFSDGGALDVTKPFYPLGAQPQPGSAFYFSSEEVFSKPGAAVTLFLRPVPTLQDQLSAGAAGIRTETDAQPLPHTVCWEYWDGRNWKKLLTSFNTPTSLPDPASFTGTGVINLMVPPDMVRTKINDQDGLWMRARLASGGFGFTRQVTFTDATDKLRTFAYSVAQPPSLADFRLGYMWQYGPVPPEHVLAYNDFQYDDRTDTTTWPGRPFKPFKPVGDITPTLYLGFDKPLVVDNCGLYCALVEQRGDTEGPALLWEYWDGFAWQYLAVGDETRNLRIPGLVTFTGPGDSQSLARFDTPLYWLRVRLKDDGPPGEPQINSIYLNAVWAVQHQTITDEPMGTSAGQPNQVFAFRQTPVLPGEQIAVRELTGPRADVEWRIVAMSLFNGNPKALQQLETLLASEGSQTDIEIGDLRLRRDRNKRVDEVWVRWQERPDFLRSGPGDRHCLVDHARGRLLFGDGDHGMIPPPAAAIAARLYQTGGGLAGNVMAQTITQVLGPLAGVEKVFNPEPATGGTDGETLAALAARGPSTLSHRGRAVTPQAYETLAREASPAVAVARAIPCKSATGRKMPGWVTLVLIPQSAEPRPYPSFGLRAKVRSYVAARAPACVSAAQHIYVTGPDYVAVDVEAILVPLDPSEAGAVEQFARVALETFLHPLQGGRAGRGWSPGDSVFLSDVATALEQVDGVDHVSELALLVNGVLQGDPVTVAEDQVVVAGDLRVKMIEG